MTKDQFKALRQRLGLTREQMGRELGVSYRAVYRYEEGRTIPGPVLRCAELLWGKQNG